MNKKELDQSNLWNDGISPIVSTTDLTGLIPTGGNLPQELEAYEQMYAFMSPNKPPKKSFGNIGN